MEKQPTKGIHEGFVNLKQYDPSILVDARYFTSYNFLGQKVDGYKNNVIIVSKEIAEKVHTINKDLNQIGYNLVVYDAYRPQKAVDHFVRWAADENDIKMKLEYYNFINKKDIIPGGYIAKQSQHTRGCAIDLTIIELKKELKAVEQIVVREITLEDGKTILYQDDGTVFMGTHFDYFGVPSHHDNHLVCKEALANRQILRQNMLKHGFKEFKGEWWHYSLINQPYPDTYFDFDIL